VVPFLSYHITVLLVVVVLVLTYINRNNNKNSRTHTLCTLLSLVLAISPVFLPPSFSSHSLLLLSFSARSIFRWLRHTYASSSFPLTLPFPPSCFFHASPSSSSPHITQHPLLLLPPSPSSSSSSPPPT
jgi:hypothetical protein